MFPYIITLLPLEEFMQKYYPGVLWTWQKNDMAMIGTTQKNTKLLRQIMENFPQHGRFTYMEKIWYVFQQGAEEEEARE